MLKTAEAAAAAKGKKKEKERHGGGEEAAAASSDSKDGDGFVKALTAKQIKKLAKPEFEANPEKFYPTKTLTRLGYSRAKCSCGHFYWRHTPKATTCGDSQCEKKYHFIGKGTGIGRKGKKITYAQAWEGFERSLSSARVPCISIKRYPVVARWRADVDYVAAGIFCFQPYCVTGELEPPANPLICPQFCLRFNDLDNIGLTGRHYSGFIMLGIQVFNKPNNKKFWNDECVEFNYNWLTKELEIDPDEITFIEDVWAGGGNLGPSIEYFVGGLELGNMVFMQFKTFPDGRREPLQVQVIDVGIGLERVPWLINGSPTSYMDVFPSALKFLLSKIPLSMSSGVWEKYGPYSCLLNVDEVEDLEKTWEFVASKTDLKAAEVKAAIEPVRDAYIVLDHTRSILMAVTDGSLPSNAGGAANLRNQLRRVFAILAKRGWWECLGMEGFLQLFDAHKADLATIYGPFGEYQSFEEIIKLEYQRWQTTDDVTKTKLKKHLTKSGGKLSIDDWILFVTSFGIPVDTIAQISGLEVPGKLFLELAERAESLQKATPTQLYSTAHLKPTVSLFYESGHETDYEFKAKILEVVPNVTAPGNPLTVVILDQSSFYPTSGGQEHDVGKMTIDGKTYDVVDATKVGPCVLHFLGEPLPNEPKSYVGKAVSGAVDMERREQLRNHHTATHIVFAACRKVLGPHVWQHGAKKTLEGAHLDITHFRSLTHAENQKIENEANRIVHRCRDIRKGNMPKDEAEKKFGFSLYQGGVVPGNSLRVVDIVGVDTEACCGTHCDNTAQVGTIKLQKSQRISDGILRLYYVAGELALKHINEESTSLNTLLEDWAIPQKDLKMTADRFFDGYKKATTEIPKKNAKILELTMKNFLLDNGVKSVVFRTEEADPTMFIKRLPAYSADLKAQGKSVVFLGTGFAFGVIGGAAPTLKPDLESLIKAAEEGEEKRLAGKKAKAAKYPKKGAPRADGGDEKTPAAAAAAAPAAAAETKKDDKKKGGGGDDSKKGGKKDKQKGGEAAATPAAATTATTAAAAVPADDGGKKKSGKGGAKDDKKGGKKAEEPATPATPAPAPAAATPAKDDKKKDDKKGGKKGDSKKPTAEEPAPAPAAAAVPASPVTPASPASGASSASAAKKKRKKKKKSAAAGAAAAAAKDADADGDDGGDDAAEEAPATPAPAPAASAPAPVPAAAAATPAKDEKKKDDKKGGKKGGGKADSKKEESPAPAAAPAAATPSKDDKKKSGKGNSKKADAAPAPAAAAAPAAAPAAAAAAGDGAADGKKGDNKKGAKNSKKGGDNAAPAAAPAAADAAAPAKDEKKDDKKKGGGKGDKAGKEKPAATAAPSGKDEAAPTAAAAPATAKKQPSIRVKENSGASEFQVTNLPGDIKDAIAFWVAKNFVEREL